jgi:hypothetical protein
MTGDTCRRTQNPVCESSYFLVFAFYRADGVCYYLSSFFSPSHSPPSSSSSCCFRRCGRRRRRRRCLRHHRLILFEGFLFISIVR